MSLNHSLGFCSSADTSRGFTTRWVGSLVKRWTIPARMASTVAWFTILLGSRPWTMASAKAQIAGPHEWPSACRYMLVALSTTRGRFLPRIKDNSCITSLACFMHLSDFPESYNTADQSLYTTNKAQWLITSIPSPIGTKRPSLTRENSSRRLSIWFRERSHNPCARIAFFADGLK